MAQRAVAPWKKEEKEGEEEDEKKKKKKKRKKKTFNWNIYHCAEIDVA
jgi:hypothetical protein